MTAVKVVFNKLRDMSGGSLTQTQVNAADKIIETFGSVDVLMEALGMEEFSLKASTLKKIAPDADTSFVDIINKHAPTFGINDKTRMSMFLAHALHESSEFNRLEESFNYRPDRLRAVFPTRIPSLNFATNLINKGQAEIANHLYGGRYGNNTDNDGWLYRGRGLGGLTFRDNYALMQKILMSYGIEYDIVNNPDLLKEKEVAVLTYMAYWDSRNLNKYADAKDIKQATKAINGGYNGLADREKYYARCLKNL